MYLRLMLFLGVILIPLLGFRPSYTPPVASVVISTPDNRLDLLERRMENLSAEMKQTTITYIREILPLEVKLLKRARTGHLAKQAAIAIYLEAPKRHISTHLIAGMMSIENPWLVLDTTSSVGATGWMQIMPFHASDKHPCGGDLTDGVTNTCYGVDILRRLLGPALDGAINTSLNRYSGCVSTPGCELYADKVLAKSN